MRTASASALALALAGALFPFAAAAQVKAPEGIPVAVLDRAIAKGERIDASDFASELRAPAMARGALGVGDAIGKEAVRNLNAGAVVRRGDVIPVQLVRRGEPVSIRYVRGGLTIAATGRALGGGGEGDLVRVVVTATSKTMDAVVEATGSVRIIAP